jgi:hypothetical protein
VDFRNDLAARARLLLLFAIDTLARVGVTRWRTSVLGMACAVFAVSTAVLLWRTVIRERGARGDGGSSASSRGLTDPQVEAELRGDIARLERQVGALAAAVSARGAAAPPRETAAPAGAEATTAPGAGAKTAPGEDVRGEAAEKLRSMFEELDRRAASEVPDPSWRPEAGLQAALQGLATPPAVRSVRCTAAFCRVEVAVQSPEERHALSGKIAELEPFASGTTYRQDPNDPLHVWLYVQRPGRNLDEPSSVVR